MTNIIIIIKETDFMKGECHRIKVEVILEINRILGVEITLGTIGVVANIIEVVTRKSLMKETVI